MQAVLDDIVDSPSSQYLSNGGSHEDERSAEQAFVSPLPKDPKSEKAEKKRLEQEKKDSEKQAKEQLKRQQKEEAKQKKDTSKADMASKEDISPNAELSAKKISSRKEERKENKKKRSLFSSAKKDGARPRNTVQCRVLLLDGSDCELQMDVITILCFISFFIFLWTKIHLFCEKSNETFRFFVFEIFWFFCSILIT